MTDSPLHVFVQEPAFQDRLSFDYDPTVGGPGRLSSFSRTFFVEKNVYRDMRSDRTTDVNLGAGTRASLWVDPVVSDAELLLLNTVVIGDVWNDIFDLVDMVGFSFLPQQTESGLNQRLQNDSPIYVPNTLRFDTGTELVTVYRDSGTTTDIIIPRSARLQIRVPVPDDDASGSGSGSGSGNSTNTYATQEIWFWYHDDAFRESYPNSYITEVLLPVLVNDLLNASLIDQNRNIFNSGDAIASRYQTQLNNVIGQKDNSGAIETSFSVKGQGGNDINMPFILIYKGRLPDRERIRKAIRNHLLNTGVGTREDWKVRIPDLFVDGQVFLVPMWDRTVTRPSAVIQTNIITFAQLINTVLSTLPQIDRDFAINNSSVFTASYDYIPIAATPNPQNVFDLDFQEDHITFQPTKTTDPAFVIMDEETKDFSIKLNKALAVAAEKSVDNEFEIITTSYGQFVNFNVMNVEFMVMTPETLTNKKEGNL